MSMPPIRFLRSVVLVPALLVSACGSPEQRAQGYYERGMGMIEKKDDLHARVELLNAVKYKSDKIEVWRALAGIDERTGAAAAFFQDLRRIVELDPADATARLKLAKILLDGGATDAALRIVEDAPRPNPELTGLKAVILAKNKDSGGAQLEAQKALDVDPGNIDAATVLAADKLRKGDPEGALKILAAPVIVAKKDFRANLMRAQLLAQKGDLSSAESVVHELIAERPKEAALRGLLVQIYIAARKFDEAEAELRVISKDDPDNKKVGLDVVRFLISTKGAAAGREELVKRIAAGGDTFAYQIELAEVDFGLGKQDDSIALLKNLAAAPGSPDQTLTAEVKLAELQFRKADLAAAETTAAGVLRKDPRNVGALKVRASVELEHGQTESAIAHLREALNGQPRAVDLLLLMAIAYEKDGKLELAERQYADAGKIAVGNREVALRFVAFLERQGKRAQAEDVLTEAVSADPRNVDLLVALARIRLAQQKWDGALAVADTIANLGSERAAMAHQIRAVAYAGQNKRDQSIASLEAAHAAAPDELQPVSSLVNAFVQSGKPEKAEALLDDLIKKHPNSAPLSLLMGSTLAAMNDADQASVYLRSAITQRANDPAGYAALSSLYVRQKKFDEAARVLNAGLQEQPRDYNLRFALLGVKILQGDVEAAMAGYEAILKEQPNSAVAANNLASLIMENRTDQKDLDRAYALADSVKALEGGEFKDTVGWAQYRRGDFPAAVVTLEDAAKKLPNNSSVRYHLGLSYKAAGQASKAAEQFKAALALETEATPLKDKIKAAMQ